MQAGAAQADPSNSCSVQKRDRKPSPEAAGIDGGRPARGLLRSAFWLRRIDGSGRRSGPHGIERNTLFTQSSP